MRERAGIDPAHGVDAVISGLARDVGLPICTELGSAESDVRMVRRHEPCTRV